MPLIIETRQIMVQTSVFIIIRINFWSQDQEKGYIPWMWTSDSSGQGFSELEPFLMKKAKTVVLEVSGFYKKVPWRELSFIPVLLMWFVFIKKLAPLNLFIEKYEEEIQEAESSAARGGIHGRRVGFRRFHWTNGENFEWRHRY